ncbi:helicase-associated domain-containing protein [Paramicrobacterium chengjingii]|uniref:Helicase-associated domain-containing protein n=1 Tax=Paramicrobacterium chengjingii TaxID=2769067 RepID=A0ABX6YEZ9_9MICO|nr:helicase-associated domain-containing protein [Microbacterium chengjingii]QPZ37358.1 helicase-associated domain-containing protein [Microbacterium chengjingii]
MTDALLLATQLRSLSDDELTALLRTRGITDDSRLNDYFDLAERLLERQRIDRALRTCDRRMLLALSAASEQRISHTLDELTSYIESLGAGTEAAEAARDGIARAGRLALVVIDDHRVHPLDAVSAALDELRNRGLPPTKALADHPPTALGAVGESDRVDAAAGERAFTTTTAAGEIVTELLRAPAKELGRGGLALPDSRRLASATGVDFDAIATVLTALAAAEFVALDGRHWAPTQAGLDWLALPTVDRWLRLATAWVEAIPDDARPLLTTRRDARWAHSVRTFATWLYPVGGDALNARVDSLIAQADVLGVIANDTLSQAGRELLVGTADAAAKFVRATLPQEVSQVYVQDDLSVISPGPLSPSRDARLRLMADIESRSQATTYRFSRSSIDRALSAGDDEAGIVAFLTDLSLTGIPQPLRYLISDVAAHHGLLRVRESSGDRHAVRSSIRSIDDDLLETLTVDQNLASLALHRTAPGLLESRFSRDLVFWALQDARYPVSAEDENGRLIRVTRHHIAHVTAEPEPNVTELVTRLRTSVKGTSAHPDDAWLVRQLELAVRSKATVVVSVAMPGGKTIDLSLEPTGIGGGRLRGRDSTADVERTLPLSSIISVSRADL